MRLKLKTVLLKQINKLKSSAFLLLVFIFLAFAKAKPKTTKTKLL